MPSLSDRIKNSWNAFLGRDPTDRIPAPVAYGSRSKPDRVRLSNNNARSIVAPIYNQIAVDCSLINIRHVKVDENDKFLETIDSPLNNIFKCEANLDQSGRHFVRDIVTSMFDEGCIAIVPTETNENPFYTDGFKVYTARTGKIVEWFPQHIRVEVYNEKTAQKQQIILEKRFTPIIENPFYETMNEPNSIAQRLIRVLNQLDRTNDQNSSTKIDMLVQLPYSIRGEALKERAEERRKALEDQLRNSQYGIGYIDTAERVIQLNRSLENNLWVQAKELLVQLYEVLGFSEEILKGTANEETMLNYNNKTIKPVMFAICEEIERKWISKTARSQKQAVKFFTDPFSLVPATKVAELSDKLVRNEVATTNEVRAFIGMKPVDDPKANELRNPNISHPDEEGQQDNKLKSEDIVE